MTYIIYNIIYNDTRSGRHKAHMRNARRLRIETLKLMGTLAAVCALVVGLGAGVAMASMGTTSQEEEAALAEPPTSPVTGPEWPSGPAADGLDVALRHSLASPVAPEEGITVEAETSDVVVTEETQKTTEATCSEDPYDYGHAGNEGVLTREGGVNYHDGWRETWYSQRVLPGEGLDIPGRHVAEDGTVRDADGNICVASSDLPYGSLVDTSLGQGKVYDTGCASGTIDIYVDW